MRMSALRSLSISDRADVLLTKPDRSNWVITRLTVSIEKSDVIGNVLVRHWKIKILRFLVRADRSIKKVANRHWAFRLIKAACSRRRRSCFCHAGQQEIRNPPVMNGLRQHCAALQWQYNRICCRFRAERMGHFSVSPKNSPATWKATMLRLPSLNDRQVRTDPRLR